MDSAFVAISGIVPGRRRQKHLAGGGHGLVLCRAGGVLLYGEQRNMNERFWENICGYHVVWRAIITLLFIFILLQLFVLFIGGISERSYYIYLLNFALLLPLLAVTVYVVYRCEARLKEV